MNFFILNFFILLKFLQVFGVSVNSELVEGDRCKLDKNQSGICKNARNCEYALQIIAGGRSSELSESRCQFKGKESIVCCQEGTPAPTATTAPAQTKPVPTYPKSKKFKMALCRNNVSFSKAIPRIFDGEPAEVGEFPFQVALGYRKQNNEIEYRCGGSLIADDIVLTAAHCANKKGNIPVTAKLGRVSLVPNYYDYGEGEDIDIQSIKLHQKYSTVHKQNDIAIIKLKEPTKFTSPIERICLSSNDLDLPKNFTITGFGRNDIATSNASTWLLRAIVKIRPLQQCKRDMNELINITESQFCALGYKGADSCKGDSGGPVSFIKKEAHYLYGIVSYGIGCGGAFPAIYTKVNEHLEWIDNVMYEFEQN